MFIQQGKTNWIFIIIVALVSGAVGGGLISYINNTIRQTDSLAQATGLNLKNNQNGQVVKENPASNLDSQEGTGLPATNDGSNLSQYSNGEDWFQYDNKELGFSIILPKRAGGDRITVFKDISKNLVYVVPANNYNSLQAIDDYMTGVKDNQWPGNPYLGATIRVANVLNDTQLDQFIKASYGQSCVFKKAYLYGSDKDSVYSITATDATYGNSDQSGCGLRNEMGYKVLYYPSIHKIIGLALGQQECLFGQLAGQACFDQLILSSLKFND